jgi:integrase
MKLTNLAVQNAKAKEAAYKLSDGHGMFLLITSTGSKYWRLKYRFAGKEKLLALGTYPEVSLSDARDKRFKARKLLQNGTDPGADKQEKKLEAKYRGRNTFKAVAEEWFEHSKGKWTPDHAYRVRRRLEMHAFNDLGHRPIQEIKPNELLEVIRKVEKNGKTDMSHCVFQTCNVIFRYAIATGRAEFNPAASLQGALKPHAAKHFPTIQAKELPEFYKKLFEEPKVGDITKLAIRLLLMTFVRQGELRQARWDDIDFKDSEWRLPAETTKMRTLHIVPLAKQTIQLLKELHKLSGTHPSGLLFPNQQRRKHVMMSENTVNHALNRMGYKGRLVGHGFRSLASTTLNEMGVSPDVIERQLAHMERNGVRAAYNHAEYLTERRKMMQTWADYLDKQAAKIRK